MAGWLEGIFSQGTGVVAQKTASFAEARNAMLADNIANIDTAGYKTRDLPVAEFQAALSQAVARSQATGGLVRLKGSENITVGPGGQLSFTPVEVSDNLLFHDGANRSVEQEMSELAKNSMLYRVAIEVLRKQNETLEAAIREKA